MAPVFLLAVAGAVALSGRLGGEFLPLIDDGRIMVKVKMPTGASVMETDWALRQIEARIQGDPLVQSAFTLAGGYVKGLTTYEVANEGEADIQLVPKSGRNISTGEYVARLRKAAELSVSVADVATSLRSLIAGAVATCYRDGGE